MELTEEQKKAAREAIEAAAKEVFPTKKEKARKIILGIVTAVVLFCVGVGFIAIGWNMCLCWLFPSLPVLSFWQLVVFQWGICFTLFPVTYSINQYTKRCTKGE